MIERYTLTVSTDFAAAHLLRDYPGQCSRLHGHNWKVELEVTAYQLDEVGMAIDFKSMKTALREVTAQLDHRHLNDLAPFHQINPTAENIAAFIYRETGKIINSERCFVKAVTVWETERARVRYEQGCPTPSHPDDRQPFTRKADQG